MDNRRMCPHCRAFVTSSDKICPYCGERIGQRAIDVRSPAAILGLIPAKHFTTALILLINLSMFAASWWLGRSPADGGMGQGIALWALGGKYGESIWKDHEYWRFVTAGFLHGNLLHIAFNSWALYVLGAQVEEIFATPRFLVVYFASTIGGFYLSARMNPGLSIGASAGVMGLIGAMVAFGTVNRTSIGRQIRNHYLGWLGMNLAFGFMPGSQVDNWAHVGGFVAGFAVAYVAGTPVHSSRAREAAWRVGAAACLMLTAWCFFLMYRNFPTPDQLR